MAEHEEQAGGLRWNALVKPDNGGSTRDKGAVAVVLGYYNGIRFLGEQLESIVRQTYQPVDIFIADDSSSSPVDLALIQSLRVGGTGLYLARQPANVGFNQNFLSALAAVPDRYEYFAFSDQDDVWYEDKLEKAVAAIRSSSAREPVLYCARTALMDSNGRRGLGLSPHFRRPPDFRNALVQNIAGGNTMVFNRPAREVILKAVSHQPIVFYDWSVYQIISGAGGAVHYDPSPCLCYRQHANNVIGSNNRWRDRLSRVQGLIAGQYKRWIDTNLAALSASRHILTAENQKQLNHFMELRNKALLPRLSSLHAIQVYRQPLAQNCALQIALALGKV